jgi:DNA-binding NarL/FixJ family response regulator
MATSRRKRPPKPLRVLLLEDDSADAELIVAGLERSGLRVTTRRVSSKAGFIEALVEFDPDVVLSDHGLAAFNSPAALELLRGSRPGTPFVVVSGAIDEATAVTCLRRGAEDIILKSNLSRLPGAIVGAVSTRKKLRALSPRQLQVLQLVAEGLTTREIGRRLRVGIKTAESHRAEVMKRLGIHDVVDLVRFAVRVGVIAAEA